MALYADIVTEWQKKNGDLVFSDSAAHHCQKQAKPNGTQFQEAQQHNRDQSHNKDDNSTIEHTR